MKQVTFITGNSHKAERLAEYLRLPILYQKIDLEEIQSLDLREIVEHKVRQAYDIIHTPVLVEDVSLEFKALGKLPGPFIKFFEKELGLEKLIELAGKDRSSVARCVFGYYDGTGIKFFEGSIEGSITTTPRGNGGFGWDKIFVPYFTDKTAAELNEEQYERFYTEEKPFTQIRHFLEKL